MPNIKKITEYPVAASLGTTNYVVGTVDNQTKRIPTNLIGGQSDFTVTVSTTDGVTFTADKTYSDTMAAHNNGQRVMFKVPAFSITIEATIFGSTGIGFSFSAVYNGQSTITTCYLLSNNSVVMDMRSNLENPPHNYAYEGVNLKTVFGTAAAFHAAVAAGDFSRIRVGDYWPITLTGNYRDYGEGTNVGEYTTKTFSNASVKLEVAGINPYFGYGNSGAISNGTNHILFVSRDCLPATFKMRKSADLWEDSSTDNPWLGSALYKTLNDQDYGILKLVKATDIGAYVYTTSSTNHGMKFRGEKRDSASATTFTADWYYRGELFLPTESEVWGDLFEADYYETYLPQIPLFRDGRLHQNKHTGDGSSTIAEWFLQSSVRTSTAHFCLYGSSGYPRHQGAAYTGSYIPLCFIVT